jgi:hypothetical protein
MNTLISLATAFAGAAVTVGAVAVTASVAPESVAKPAVTAAKAKSSPTDIDEAFRAVQQQREAWRSTQDHFRRMDQIRSRTW